MARVQRELSPTGCYHIMLRGNERKKIFLDSGDRQRFLDTLAKKKNEIDFAFYAYCLMDNHIHLVIRDDQNQIAVIMKGIATSYAMFFNIKYSRVGHVFQDRFKSEPIVDERQLLAAIRYVHNNPVKAGMVDRPDAYEWSSYQDYLNKSNATFVDVKSILEMFASNRQSALREFKRFSDQQDDCAFLDESEESIRTVEEGRQYLSEYMAKAWPGASLEDLLEDKKTRSELIKTLKIETSLSIRKIAELLGVNRRVVERVKP
ncbi:MAG: transposase [Acidobacteriota bacterium]